jgi:ribonuclease HI
VAVRETVEQVPKNVELDIISDSKYTIDGLTKNLKKSEDQGYSTTANKAVTRLTAAKLRTRKAKTIIKWVEGHSRDPGSEAADKLADKGEKKEASDIISNRARRNLAVHGAKLAVMPQSLAYRIIRQIKMEKDGYQDALDRNGTRRNMELAKGAAEDNNNKIPSTKRIRRSTQHKDISRNIRAFMWMNLQWPQSR